MERTAHRLLVGIWLSTLGRIWMWCQCIVFPSSFHVHSICQPATTWLFARFSITNLPKILNLRMSLKIKGHLLLWEEFQLKPKKCLISTTTRNAFTDNITIWVTQLHHCAASSVADIGARSQFGPWVQVLWQVLRQGGSGASFERSFLKRQGENLEVSWKYKAIGGAEVPTGSWNLTLWDLRGSGPSCRRPR